MVNCGSQLVGIPPETDCISSFWRGSDLAARWRWRITLRGDGKGAPSSPQDVARQIGNGRRVRMINRPLIPEYARSPGRRSHAKSAVERRRTIPKGG